MRKILFIRDRWTGYSICQKNGQQASHFGTRNLTWKNVLPPFVWRQATLIDDWCENTHTHTNHSFLLASLVTNHSTLFPRTLLWIEYSKIKKQKWVFRLSLGKSLHGRKYRLQIWTLVTPVYCRSKGGFNNTCLLMLGRIMLIHIKICKSQHARGRDRQITKGSRLDWST